MCAYIDRPMSLGGYLLFPPPAVPCTAHTTGWLQAPEPAWMRETPWSELYTRGQRTGLLPAILGSILTVGDPALSTSIDFLIDAESVPRPRKFNFVDGKGEVRSTPNRTSWDYSTSLLNAPDLCQDLLLMTDDEAITDLRAVVVALEPTVSDGYHPCLNKRIRVRRIYSPKLVMMIRNKEGGDVVDDIMTAAALALFRYAYSSTHEYESKRCTNEYLIE